MKNSQHNIFMAAGFSSILIAVCSIFVASCTRDADFPSQDYIYIDGIAPREYPAAKAAMDDQDTKTYLSGVEVKWNKGDVVSARYAGGVESSANENEDGTSARFRFPVQQYRYAYYPGGKGSALNDYTLSVTDGFPSTQTATQNGFANGVNLMVANAASTNSWQFENAGALLTFRLSHTGGDLTLSKIKVTNKAMTSCFSGDASIVFDNSGNISGVNVQNGSNYAELTGQITIGSESKDFWAQCQTSVDKFYT